MNCPNGYIPRPEQPAIKPVNALSFIEAAYGTNSVIWRMARLAPIPPFLLIQTASYCAAGPSTVSTIDIFDLLSPTSFAQWTVDFIRAQMFHTICYCQGGGGGGGQCEGKYFVDADYELYGADGGLDGGYLHDQEYRDDDYEGGPGVERASQGRGLVGLPLGGRGARARNATPRRAARPSSGL